VAALSAIPLAAQAGPNTGSCSPGAYAPAGTTGTNPVTGGAYYVNAPTGAGTSGSTGAGTSGSPGYIQGNATGTAGPPPSGSATVEGNQTNSGVNGKVVVGTSPSACAGSTVAGAGVQVP
jgi:hypothetical protein